jgi:hypothetical protein
MHHISIGPHHILPTHPTYIIKVYRYRQDKERVQKTALHILLGESYGSYRNALESVSLESLDKRRQKLCLKFAKKALRHEKHTKWFVPNVRLANTRLKQDKFCPVYAKHKRIYDIPISYLTRLLNSDSSKLIIPNK